MLYLHSTFRYVVYKNRYGDHIRAGGRIEQTENISSERVGAAV